MAAPEFHEHGYKISLQGYKKLEFRAEETVNSISVWIWKRYLAQQLLILAYMECYIN